MLLKISVTISPPECPCFIHSPHLHTELFGTCCRKPFAHVWVCDSQNTSREKKNLPPPGRCWTCLTYVGDSLFFDKWTRACVGAEAAVCVLSITDHLREERWGSREHSGKNGGRTCEIDRPYSSVLQFSESVCLSLCHLLHSPFHTLFPLPDLWDLKVHVYSDQISAMRLEN